MARTFSQRLRELLAAKDWTPYKLSQETGVPRSNLSAYLAGDAFPGEKTLSAMAEKLGVDVDELHTFVKLSQIGPDYEAKVRRYVPELFAAPPAGARRAREAQAPRYAVPRMAAGYEGNPQADPDRVEHDVLDEPFSEE